MRLAPHRAASQSRRARCRGSGERRGLPHPHRVTTPRGPLRSGPDLRLPRQRAPLRRGSVACFHCLDGTGGTPRASACDGKERATSHHIPSHSDLNDPRARHLRTFPPQKHGERVLDGDRKGGAALPRRLPTTRPPSPPYFRWSKKTRVRNHRGRRLPHEKVTGSDGSRCAIARVSAQDQQSASAAGEGDGLRGDDTSSPPHVDKRHPAGRNPLPVRLERCTRPRPA